MKTVLYLLSLICVLQSISGGKALSPKDVLDSIGKTNNAKNDILSTLEAVASSSSPVSLHNPNVFQETDKRTDIKGLEDDEVSVFSFDEEEAERSFLDSILRSGTVQNNQQSGTSSSKTSITEDAAAYLSLLEELGAFKEDATAQGADKGTVEASMQWLKDMLDLQEVFGEDGGINTWEEAAESLNGINQWLQETDAIVEEEDSLDNYLSELYNAYATLLLSDPEADPKLSEMLQYHSLLSDAYLENLKDVNSLITEKFTNFVSQIWNTEEEAAPKDPKMSLEEFIHFTEGQQTYKKQGKAFSEAQSQNVAQNAEMKAKLENQLHGCSDFNGDGAGCKAKNRCNYMVGADVSSNAAEQPVGKCVIAPYSMQRLVDTDCQMESRGSLLSIAKDLYREGYMEYPTLTYLMGVNENSVICRVVAHSYFASPAARTTMKAQDPQETAAAPKKKEWNTMSASEKLEHILSIADEM